MLFALRVFLFGLTSVSIAVEGLGLRCLRCDDVLEPRFCERIEYCSAGDVCSVQRYRKDNGDVTFWVGCLPQTSCSKTPNKTVLHSNRRSIHGSVVCNDCCYGDLCNVDGCGSPAFPTSRGPICFNCGHTLNPTDCHHMTVCGTNELCFLGEKPLFGQRYFTSHCEDIHACNNHISAPIIVGKKRSYTPCSGCCHGDLCNNDCNANFTSGTVINTGAPALTVKPTTLETPGNYAFYAQLTSSLTQNNVIFNNVTTNEGSSYNGRTGIFTCKYSGPYVFSWTVGTHDGRQANTDLIVNSNVKGTIHSDSLGSSTNTDSATGLIVTKLQVGDEVRVRVSNGTIEGQYSTFSGWRLNQNIYFHAKAKTALSRPSSNRQGFIFEEVDTNSGHSYFSGNGTFVCPESGLYALAFTVEAKHKDYMVYFYKDRSKVNNLGVWPDSSNGEYLDSSATVQLFQLSAGDAIYLYAGDSDAQLEPIRSTYSGWLIEPGTSVNTPAFLEQLTSSSPLSHSAVLFNSELLDTTQSFYSSTGFTAPQNGVYMIFWNMEAYDRYLKSTLVVNGVEYGYTVSDGASSDYDSGSNVAVLRLRSSDVVKVIQSTRADGDQTIISGYKLF
ncbi:uncharacterized protein LOC125658910 [Ostrea edulis]|uniref:uncharacterized protein LOC125658910 n=1 Tax=Ostrea edulis TaxID=37623 RepID=UPI0024AF0913|nr:uncharacterized protein LOC125658910 [Ostrea edulis]